MRQPRITVPGLNDTRLYIKSSSGKWTPVDQWIILRTDNKDPNAVALGSKGGKASKGRTSPAKARAARQNGKKGGRPKKERV